MSLFNPIASQHRRLMEELETLPAMPIEKAAKLMRVPSTNVARNIEKMKKKGLFTGRQPLVHQGLKMVVLDEAYLPFAYVCQEGDALLRDTRQAMSLLESVNDPTQSQKRISSARSRAFSSFMRDITRAVDPWTSNVGSRARSLLRDLIDPSPLVADELNQTHEALGVLTSLENYLESLFNALFAHPNLVSQQMLPVLQGAHRDLNAYLSSLPAARGGSHTWSAQADSNLRRLREDDLPRIAALVDEVHSNTGERKPAKKKEDPLLSELAQEIYRLETLASQLPSSSIAASLRNIAEKLSRIRNLLIQSPEKSRMSCVRSLRDSYLPMTDELLSKYMQSLSLSTPAAEAAVKATEQVFSGVLPQALQQITDQLTTDNAIDMRSQADALVKKMQLDGLLPYNFEQKAAAAKREEAAPQQAVSKQ